MREIIMAATPVPFVPQTPPPTPMPAPTSYVGENCLWSTGATLHGSQSKIHSGYIMYCAMPDPNPAKAGHFDTNDCFQYASFADHAATYCAITPEVPMVSGGNDPILGLPGPAWMWLLLAVILFVWLARMFGPKTGGWKPTNIPGVMAKTDKK